MKNFYGIPCLPILKSAIYYTEDAEKVRQCARQLGTDIEPKKGADSRAILSEPQQTELGAVQLILLNYAGKPCMYTFWQTPPVLVNLWFEYIKRATMPAAVETTPEPPAAMPDFFAN